MKKFSVKINMNPADLAVNAAFRAGKNRRGGTSVRKSDRYAGARALVGEASLLRAMELGFETLTEPACVVLRWSWDGREPDVDAPIKGALDALQDAGILEDDRIVSTLVVIKSRGEPALEVWAGPDTLAARVVAWVRSVFRAG